MDSISNMIIIMKNGSLAGLESVSFPYSKMKNDNIYCVILGYTSVHKNYVNSNNIKNVILLDAIQVREILYIW